MVQSEMKYDLVVVGGGPAGLAAAISAAESGLTRILLVERDVALGGILNQCIHSGFGLHEFREELTGPEYALRFIQKLNNSGVEVWLDTMVMQIIPDAPHRLQIMSAAKGLVVVSATTIVLAMGCRERTRFAIATPGARVAGVLTAGTAQRYLNIEGYHVGKKALILGSGDIGLIMARRLTLEGAEIVACVELMPYSSGLERNISQCLDDFGIPLLLSYTIVDIQGKDRVSSVTVAAVDDKLMPIMSTCQTFEVDTVLLSVGLIPENELSREAQIALDQRTMGVKVYENMETSCSGIFACGNVCHVHDLVDFVSQEGRKAGKNAATFVLARSSGAFASADEVGSIAIETAPEIAYTVPAAIHQHQPEKNVDIFFRVRKVYKHATKVALWLDDELLQVSKFSRLMPGELAHLTIQASKISHTAKRLYLEVQDEA